MWISSISIEKLEVMILFPHDILCLLNDNELNNDLFFSFLAYFLTYVNCLLTVFN